MTYGCYVDTPIGRLGLVCSEHALRAVVRAQELAEPLIETPLAKLAAEQMREYFSGVRREFDLPIAEDVGTVFQKKVWQAVCRIPYGQTRSYRDVAQMAGHPKAARAVGGAVGQTPFPVVVPCHRVISASGALGGYGGRTEEKEYLLGMEKQVCRKDAKKVYVLFDLDGTLTDPKEGITRSVQYALEDFGIHEPDLDQLTCFIGPPLAESFREYYGFDEVEAARAVKKYRERFSDVGIYENRVLEGTQDMLAALKAAGRVVCLATSKPEVFAKKILKKYGLDGFFDVAVGSELDGRRGTKAEVIEEALRRAGAQNQREKAVMVGDRRQDIEGAKQCGLSSIGVQFGYAEPGELEKAGADYVAGSMEELKNVLLAW